MLFSRKPTVLALAGALFAALSAPAGALTIQLDYSLDSSGFFDRTPAAKAAVAAAAADIGAVITSSLGAISTDSFLGTKNTTEATIHWDIEFTHPGTGATFILDNFNVAANTVRLYVGMRALSGTTLGVGGPGGGSFSIRVGGFENEMNEALDNAELSSNNMLRRPGGPLMQSYNGSLTFEDSPTVLPYSLQTGSIVGALSFDLDTDNDNVTDSDDTLAAFWHYDHTAPVASGKNDLYSVAVHEILHSLGSGTSQAWEDLANGANWLGVKASALAGSGANLVTLDGHIANGHPSFRITDDGAQDPVMSPSITVGTRKSLTDLDLAFLEDIGWTVVPEPGFATLLLGALLPLSALRRRARD